MKSEQEQYNRINEAKEFIASKLSLFPEICEPKALIICGSGLGGIAEILQGETLSIPYSSIPHFKTSTVAGHVSHLLFGSIGTNKVPVMCMVGRLHFYEGYDFEEATFPVRVASVLGISNLIVTNAAGGINPNYKAGDLMVINDHLNFPGLAGYHVLRGPNLSVFGPRFLPLSDAYDFGLRVILADQAKNILKLDRKIHEGVYFYASGPSYESRAEARMIGMLGGDCVGMSTVPEVIIARHCGMKVLGISLITNNVVTAKPESAFDFVAKVSTEIKNQEDGIASHAEVLESAQEASEDVKRLVEATVNLL
ncbi:unnamed protein product [[Candida] boidinii]|uniref:Purine nucleoside phosphorylase n=1 Tax=Candida boidinii TaxID=5477 RepID=A0A9W6W7P1_CANBO|nr:hypothetical protein B5S30_g1560 [[Candida] boidinii]OWB85627.1 hypothetical protein B5S33_g4296 [[Candida] boidinii]GME67316.1 unnamed protein product [[Candida] boidinii]GMF99502.1 unnamed protein product [[Candida] boidinii]